MSAQGEVDVAFFPRSPSRDEPGLDAYSTPGGGTVFVPSGKILLWRRGGKFFRDRATEYTTTFTVGEPWRDSK